MRLFGKCFGVAAVCGVLWAGKAPAQVLGELKGQVMDATGAVVPGASVTLTQAATRVALHGVASSVGEYDFSQLNSGVYSVRVEANGFVSLVRDGVTVTTGQTVRLDLAIKPGAAGESVTVSEDAPLLQAATSDIATTIPGRQVIALPLNSRNFIQLTQLAPGVELPPGTVLPRINGGRPRTNEYLFDGISALQPEPGQVAFFPIVDDIQEFTIEANNVPAEFGRFNGGVVNVATRSGSNTPHGSLYEFLRNEDLNARNYFARTGRKPEYRRNVFGGTLGGPLLRDRLFGFADYQGVKQRIGVTRISTVPTLAERAGNFAGIATIYNPCSSATAAGRTAFAGNVINPAICPFDPEALKLLAMIPTPNTGSATATANNFTYVNNDDDHQNQFDTRLDGAFGPRDRGFARYSFYEEADKPATYLPSGGGLISGTSAVVGTNNVTGGDEHPGAAGRDQRDAYVYAAAAERLPAGLYAARKHLDRAAACGAGRAGARDTQHPGGFGIWEHDAAVHVHGLPAAWLGVECDVAVPDGGGRDRGYGGVDARGACVQVRGRPSAV